MRRGCVVVLAGLMSACIVQAQSSNDTVLLKLNAGPDTRVFFGGKEVGEAGLEVAAGASATLMVTNIGKNAYGYQCFTVVRSVADLRSYKPPAPPAGGEMARAASGMILPSLHGLSTQIDRAQSRALQMLAMQAPGTAATETVVVSNVVAKGTGSFTSHDVRTSTRSTISAGTSLGNLSAKTGGSVSSHQVRSSTSATISACRTERIVWCAENGAVNVFVCAPKAGIKPK